MADIFCLINLEPERATFTWSEGPASFEPYQLEGDNFNELREIADEAREKLANLVKDFLHFEEDVPKDAAELADVGNELYRKIFDPIAEQRRNAREVRQWLEDLRDRSDVHELEIVTDSAWTIPWNVIYDQDPKKEAFLSGSDADDHWQPFWGIRYNLSAGRKVNPLRRLPLWHKPTVLIVVDPPIRDGLPEEIQQRLQTFVETHDVTLATSLDELTDALKAGRPELLYWLSHATPSALSLAEDEISPRKIKKLFRDDDAPLGGLAFLNACQTAEAGETGSFLDAFYHVGFSGMVGTEQQTIDTFAAPRGLDFLEAFLDRGEPVGKIMHDLRRHIPLGLLYGAYCPPTLMVELESPTDGAVELIHDEPEPQQGRTLGKDSGATGRLTELPAAPYRSLGYYTREDRALFAGRDDDVERFALLLDDAAARVVVLHGESGVGKSSFLRAGVIPFLEEECPGYRFLRSHGEEQDADQAASDSESDRESVLFIRATNDLVGQFAQTIAEFCTKPLSFVTPAGRSVEVDLPGLVAQALGGEPDPGALRTALSTDLDLLARILSSISDRLPYALVMVVDQCEEIFTLAETDDDAENRRLALAMLRRAMTASGDFKIILSLRTEYYGRVIDGLRRGLADAGGVREYLLTDFDESALIDAIRLPTLNRSIPYTNDIPFEKYQFSFASGVPEEIARRVVAFTTHRRDSVLPLVQVTCTRLYRAAIAPPRPTNQSSGS